MVGWIESNEALPLLQTAAAGAVAGAVTRAICQPLDVIKIRFQLQTEPLSLTAGSKYSSMLQAALLIAREEGLAALWSGHVPAQLLSISYGLLQFVTFEKLSEACHRADAELAARYAHGVNFACGALAACVATGASFPLDTVRTRLIAEEKTRRVYGGVCDTFRQMRRAEGPRALFKGLLPTLAQIAPHAGLQFATYKFFTDTVLKRISFFDRSRRDSKERSLAGNLFAGAAAGLVAKATIYPLDLAKKRLQIQGFQQHRASFGRQFYCGGFTDCVLQIARHEGVLGLYKGLSPSMAKAVLASALHFAVYDEIRNSLLSKQ